MNPEVAWTCRRIDEFDDDETLPSGLIGIEGAILVDGDVAGLTDGFHLLDDRPWSEDAFWAFWDMEGWTCEIYEELLEPGKRRFREPLSRLLAAAPGILFVRLIALRPPFRRRGLGREVLRRWIGDWCDDSVGAVVIDATPLQRRDDGYDEYDEEVRDLPWDGEAEDADRLAGHLRGWGFHRIAGTRFMVATPAWLDMERAAEWPPVPIEDEPWDEDDVPF